MRQGTLKLPTLDDSILENLQKGKRTIKDLESTLKSLQDENAEINSLKEDFKLEKIREEISLKKRISEITSECKGLEGELSIFKQEITKLKQEILEEKKEKESLRTRNVEASQEVDKLKNMYSQKIHEYNIDINQLKGIHKKDLSKVEAKIREEILKNSKLENILKNKKEILASMNADMIAKEQDADRRVKEVREEMREKFVKVEFEKRELEQEISRINVKICDLESQHSMIKKDLENVSCLC